MKRTTVLAALLMMIAGIFTWHWVSPRIHVRKSALTGPIAPIPPVPPSPSSPRIPERIPALTLPDVNGKPRALAEWHGKPLLINFWATWCEPCREEIPLLGHLQSEFAATHLQVLGIAIDFKDAVARYTRDAPLPYPTLIAEEDGLAPEAFGVGTGLPVSVFADSQGRIVTVKTGELHAKEARLILGLIAKVDAGNLTLSAARTEIGAQLRQIAAN